MKVYYRKLPETSACCFRNLVIEISLVLLLQGARGFPGTPGLPGIKGHRVSLEER